MTIEDLQAIRQTKAFLLDRYDPLVHSMGWSVRQLARIHDLTQAQIYALDNLPDEATVKLWDKLTNELVTGYDFWKVVNES